MIDVGGRSFKRDFAQEAEHDFEGGFHSPSPFTLVACRNAQATTEETEDYGC